MSGMDLIGFLRARIDEDEATARACMPGVRAGRWSWLREPYPLDETSMSDSSGGEELIYATGYEEPDVEVSDEVAEHIARHEPARVLAEVAAKRLLIAQVATWVPAIQRPFLAPFAAVYAEHPDYDEAWRP